MQVENHHETYWGTDCWTSGKSIYKSKCRIKLVYSDPLNHLTHYHFC